MMERSHWRTLVLIVDPPKNGAGNGRILLGRKKRGFGAGKWNGFGGKLEAGESLEAAAARELYEEVGIIGQNLERRGTLSFTFANGLPPLLVQVFRGEAWEGEVRETEEMSPRWFSLDLIPYKEMWVDDPHWLPLLVDNQAFIGQFHLQNTEELLTWEVKTVAPERLARHAYS